MLAVRQNTHVLLQRQEILQKQFEASQADIREVLLKLNEKAKAQEGFGDTQALVLTLEQHVRPFHDKIGLWVNLAGEILENVKATREIAEENRERLKKIQEQLEEGAPAPISKILGTPPFFAEVFLGREEDLASIHQKLFEGDNLLLLVNGEGGIGKTTLAARYYRTYMETYAHLAWVFSENSLADALLTLALPLRLTFDPLLTNEDRLDMLLDRMRQLPKPCLLVVDNANRLVELERYYKRLRSCPNFHVLLTTRITEFEQAVSHRITPLTDKEAIALFTKYYPRHQESDQSLLEQLLVAIGKNTLVIELLAKNLYNQNRLKTRYSLHDLLKDLQQKGLLGVQSQEVSTPYQAAEYELRKEKPEDIIAAMYELGELLPDEQAMMAMMAVLPAENIPFDTLELLLPNINDLDGTLLSLSQKGWLEWNETQSSFKASPVVQEVIRKKSNQLLDACRPIIEGLIEKLVYESSTGHFLNATYDEAAVYARYAEHTASVLKSIDGDLAVLYERVGQFYRTTGNLEKTLACFEKYGQLSEELYRDQQNVSFKYELAISYEKLGETYSSLGSLEKALKYFEKLNQLSEELYRDYPQNVSFKRELAGSYSRLGETHSSLGNLEKALKYFEKYHQLSEELYQDQQNVSSKYGLAVSYGKLGGTHSSLGNLEKALEYFEKYHQLSEELYRDYPQNVSFKYGLAISYVKLGETHSSLGNLEKALKYFEKNEQLSEELHRDYPQNVSFKYGLAVSYVKLGITHSSLGNLEKALKYFEKLNQLSEELYRDYPQNVSFKHALAFSYIKMGFIHEKKENQADAIRYYQIAEKLLIQLVHQFPKYADFKKKLEWVSRKLERT